MFKALSTCGPSVASTGIIDPDEEVLEVAQYEAAVMGSWIADELKVCLIKNDCIAFQVPLQLLSLSKGGEKYPLRIQVGYAGRNDSHSLFVLHFWRT